MVKDDVILVFGGTNFDETRKCIEFLNTVRDRTFYGVENLEIGNDKAACCRCRPCKKVFPPDQASRLKLCTKGSNPSTKLLSNSQPKISPASIPKIQALGFNNAPLHRPKTETTHLQPVRIQKLARSRFEHNPTFEFRSEDVAKHAEPRFQPPARLPVRLQLMQFPHIGGTEC